MARVSKEELQRYGGAQWFERMANELGIDKASEELNGRISFGVPLQVKQSDLNECVERIKRNTIKTMLCMAAMVLHDEFDFEQKELTQFSKRFNDKVDVLNYSLAEWADYQQILKDETGIEFTLTDDIVGSEERKGA